MNDDPIAALDQALRAVADVARIVRAYFDALVEEGFTPAEALALTAESQKTLWGAKE